MDFGRKRSETVSENMKSSVIVDLSMKRLAIDRQRLGLGQPGGGDRLAEFAEKRVVDAGERFARAVVLTGGVANTTSGSEWRREGVPVHTDALAAEMLEKFQKGRHKIFDKAEFEALLLAMDAFLESALAEGEKVRSSGAESPVSSRNRDLKGEMVKGFKRLLAALSATFRS